MHLGLVQSARMEQRLVQSPQMILAMQVLQLPAMELQERIERELLENPLLEREEAAPVRQVTSTLREDERWRGEGGERRGSLEDSERKHRALQNSPDRHHSLGESLLRSLALLELDPRQNEMVEYLVYSLDARGYLAESSEELAEGSGIEGATGREFEELLEAVRHATHAGLGARDLRECLLLQVTEDGAGHALVRTLIESRLEEVAANRLPHIALATGHSLEEVQRAVELLRALDPCPGSAWGDAPGEVLRPELVVEEIEGAFQVRLADGRASGLRLSSEYAEFLRRAPRGDASGRWIRKRLEAARWFLSALEQRQDTLLCIAHATFERQVHFLRRGRSALAPLRMLDIAESEGMHLSTVSRAVSGKYVQTPRGILPLRSFFGSGVACEGGGVVSQSALLEQLRGLIEAEDSAAPLSDDQLAELLNDRGGVSLARRTIAKYRKLLAIPTSLLRRVF